MDHLGYFCLVLLYFHARLFVNALWSPAGKGLTSWLSFVMSKEPYANLEIVTLSCNPIEYSVYACHMLLFKGTSLYRLNS